MMPFPARFCCPLTDLSSVGELLHVASVVCICPVGDDPKGTCMIVLVICYNNFLLTLKNIKQKYLAKGVL